MAADLEVPTAEQVAAHYHESLVRKRSARRLMWGMIFGLVLLAMLAPVALYIAWLAHGRALLREELAKIQAAGDPITTAEMAEWYKLPEGSRDITQLWLEAIRPFGTTEYQDSCAGVPLVGFSRPPWTAPPLEQPLAAADEQAIREWLTLHQDKVAAIYAAAREEGEVRYPYDFRQGAYALTTSDHLLVHSATLPLRLEFQVFARQPNLDPAIENLATRLSLVESGCNSPSLSMLLNRAGTHGRTLEDLRQLVATDRLSDAQLARLQSLLRKLNSSSQLTDAMLGDRAMAYWIFYQELGLLPDFDDFSRRSRTPHETTHAIDTISRPEDCAMALGMYTRLLAASRLPLHEALAESKAIEQERHALQSKTLDGLRYLASSAVVVDVSAIAEVFAGFQAMCTNLDTAIATRRYRLLHAQLPQTLDQLTPDFLPHMPVDPFDGQPLRFIAQDDKLVIYSIGKDLVDDGGVCDPAKQEPDIALEVQQPSTE